MNWLKYYPQTPHLNAYNKTTYKLFLFADFNECVHANDCNDNASCTNYHGAYFCQCNLGYIGNGKNCSNVDECVPNGHRNHNCHENATCTDTDGSFNCNCVNGFQGNGTYCENVDECANSALNNCAVNATCTDTFGSFLCSCNEGHTGNGTVCLGNRTNFFN